MSLLPSVWTTASDEKKREEKFAHCSWLEWYF